MSLFDTAIEHRRFDVAIVGAGGAGLRAAIAVAQADPACRIALVSKVYPMRSHTVAAEGGAAAVTQAHDSLEAHFHDTVAGGDWLCEQDVVEDFVARAHDELVQTEHWGCPWSRRPDGLVNVRAFGGMKMERTWFAADKTGFHLLHTLFQTSIRFPSITRFDEHFCIDLLVHDDRVQGLLTVDIASGAFTLIQAPAVILATGGAGRVFRENTNGGIVTGDGMALAYRHGVPLRDMEFVQYHPTCMPGTGLLFTEACRGEGGLLLNKNCYRYLQDYGLGPALDEPRNKFMELGPRDRLSQAYWHEKQRGRTIPTAHGEVVHLDLRHLGEHKLRERLPQIYELATSHLGVDPARTPIPVLPAVHYTMGGILAAPDTSAPLAGLFSAGECSSVGLHGANRLGSNSLTELLVFGRTAGEQALAFAHQAGPDAAGPLQALAEAARAKALEPLLRTGRGERPATLRREMAQAMEDGCGIYREAPRMQATCDKLAELRQRWHQVTLDDRGLVWNTDWLQTLELACQLEVAEAMAHAALNRRESRGSHQRLDGYAERDDVNFLQHSLACHQGERPPRIAWGPVRITRSPPGRRVYGAAGEQAEAAQARPDAAQEQRNA